MAPNNTTEKVEKEIEQNDAALVFSAGTLLVSTGAAMVDIATKVLPSEGSWFIVGLIGMSALATTVCALDRLAINARAKADATEKVDVLAPVSEETGVSA